MHALLGGGGPRADGQVGGDHEAHLVDHREGQRARAEPGHLPQPGVAQVEPRAELHPGPQQRDDQHHRLDHDPGRGAEAEQHQVGLADLGDLRRAVAQQVGRRDADDHEVVQHRRPHRGGEPVAGVQDRPGHGADAEEGDLGKDELGHRHGRRDALGESLSAYSRTRGLAHRTAMTATAVRPNAATVRSRCS